MFLPALSALAHLKHGHGGKLCKPARSGTGSHRDKRIISPAASHRVKFVLPALKSLLVLSDYIFVGFLFRLLPVYAQSDILFHSMPIRFLGIGLQDHVHAGYCKAAVLLAGRAEHDIPDDIESHIQRLGLVIPDISHLKTAA